MSIDVKDGERHLHERDGEKYYFWLSEADIMFFPPNDAGVQHQETYSMLNLICRLSSMVRKLGTELSKVPLAVKDEHGIDCDILGGWSDIVRQCDGANITGNRTWCRDIAQIITDNQI